MLLRKDQLEASLHEEKKLIEDGRLKEDNPLDLSEGFQKLCEACRRGDLKLCQEMITEGANINARDRFDYSPLILASLCGHYEVVQLLLESGALCERDTFQGERCLYNALNDRIRNLLLSYDYSKSTDPLQPFAAHLTSLLTRDVPQTSDILVTAVGESFPLHKFVLSARSPYFRKKLSAAPETTSWKIPSAIPPQAFGVAMRYVYLGEIPVELGGGPGTGFSEDEILEGIDRISKHLEIRSLWDAILENDDRRLSRQRRTEEVEKGRSQLAEWLLNNVMKHKVIVDTDKADEVRWDSTNGIFADVLLRADQPAVDSPDTPLRTDQKTPNGIPIGPASFPSSAASKARPPRKSTLFPVHRAMLIRAEFFLRMFSSGFREAQSTRHLQIIPIDCSPAVLDAVLTFLYAEKAEFPLELAIDVLFAADLLLIDRLKQKAAVVISTLGNGTMPPSSDKDVGGATSFSPAEGEEEDIDIYDVVRAGWLTRVPRLEEFGARYFAHRLEKYIDEDDFADLIRESASRIKGRQETDSIELLDDIRYYLSERFRLRFEEMGMEEMMDEGAEDAEHGREPAEVKEEREEPAGVDIEGLSLAERLRKTVESDGKGQTTLMDGSIRTLDGEIAGDEFAGDAINYQILLGKIDRLLDRLKLDA
ncbi:MAG: hypothetical protein LQ348_001698 [Seirophora lacunosa]|nr:MAG: hypothetical protein LQ344_003250 [Seirophora lacunosa]KAI4200967.1 MAG: hypothetical protein LQ348_001698 [Seirophora lacunosa]